VVLVVSLPERMGGSGNNVRLLELGPFGEFAAKARGREVAKFAIARVKKTNSGWIPVATYSNVGL
jgi:hypothetical protein